MNSLSNDAAVMLKVPESRCVLGVEPTNQQVTEEPQVLCGEGRAVGLVSFSCEDALTGRSEI